MKSGARERLTDADEGRLEVGVPEQREAARELAGEEHDAGKGYAGHQRHQRLLEYLGAQVGQRRVAPVVALPAAAGISSRSPAISLARKRAAAHCQSHIP